MSSRFSQGDKLFYGWIVVIAFLVIGTLLYGLRVNYGVFFKSIAGEFTLSRAETSSIYSAYMIFGCIFAFICGWALDKYEPRAILLIMGVCAGLSLLLTSQTSAMWQLFLTYSLLLSMGTGALAATLLTIAYGRFNLKVLRDVTTACFRSVGFIFLIVAMALSFVSVFIAAGCDKVISSAILSVPGGKWGVFAIVMFIAFIMGFFIDWMGIVFILVPIVTPIAKTLGFDEIWFAMMICVNLQMSFMTPPFAWAIFFLRGQAPPDLGIALTDIIRGVIPYVIMIMICLGLMVAFPQIILWLPNQMIR